MSANTAPRDTRIAEAAFRARLAELGAELLDPWRGARKAHRVRCAEGHDAAPTPGNVQRGRGICRVCGRRQSAAAKRAAGEAVFRAALAEAGAELLDPWRGANTPHRVRCAEGHDAAPTPGNVQRGQGVCRACGGRAWDVFYVVRDPVTSRIKFGITSGDPRPRLGDHRGRGYRDVVRLFTSLPGATAPEIERAALGALAAAGISPARGREYFPAAALPVVLGIADNYPRT